MRRRAAIVPLLCALPAVAWGQTDGVSAGDTAAGLGLLGLLLSALLAFVRGQEMKGLLVAFAKVLVGASADAKASVNRIDVIEADTKRMRHSVGLAQSADEPAPGSGLLVDVARLQAQQAHTDAQIGALVASTTTLTLSLERLTAAIEAQSDARREAPGRHGIPHVD